MIKKLIFINIFIFSIHLICFSQTEDANDQKNKDENLIDSLKSLMNEYSRNCYKIEISFDGYEAGSEENWYYDSLGVICGHHVTWNMEGQSGEEFNWFENGKLSELYEETQGGNDETEVTFLIKSRDSEKLKSRNSEIKNQHQRVFKAINENSDKKSDDGYTISVTIEETVNYGMEFIQTTKIFIDNALFDLLFQN